MSYVDAGYAVGLSVLAAYALGLVVRRRSLARRVEVRRAPSHDSDPRGDGASR